MSDISFDDLVPRNPQKPARTRVEQKAGSGISFSDLTPEISEEGAPAFVRMLAGAVDKPEDKLSTVKKFYPDARFLGPSSLDADIVFTNPKTGKLTRVNPKGLDIGDIFSVAREAAQMTGATVGGTVGFAGGGIPGMMAGSGLGQAGADEAFNFLVQILGAEDARTIKERFGDAGVQAALGSVAGPGGGVAGAGGRAAVRGAFRGGSGGRQEAQQAIADLGRFGETPSVAQATQKMALDSVESFLSRAPGGAGVIRGTVKRVHDKVGGILDNRLRVLAGRSDVDSEVAGRTIIRGVDDFVDRFKGRSSKLFEDVNKFVRPETPAPAVNTRIALERLANPVEGAEETSKILSAPLVKKLQAALETDFPGGGIPFSVLQRIRSEVGSRLASFDLVADIPRGQLKQLYGAISDDLRAAAGTNKQALAAFERANRFYRAGIQRIDDVLEPLVRNRTPEKVFDALQRGTNAGATQVRATMRSLTPEQRKPVVAAITKRMGTAPAGQQTAEGGVFSFQTFLTNWNKMAPRAKAALYDQAGMKGLRQDLDALARASERMRESSKAFFNPSGTAGATIGQIMLFGTIGSLGTAPVAGMAALGFPTLVGLSIVGVNRAAKLMTSPRFVRWLSRSTKVKPNGWGSHFGRLAGVAAGADVETAEAVKDYIEAMQGAIREDQ